MHCLSVIKLYAVQETMLFVKEESNGKEKAVEGEALPVINQHDCVFLKEQFWLLSLWLLYAGGQRMYSFTVAW